MTLKEQLRAILKTEVNFKDITSNTLKKTSIYKIMEEILIEESKSNNINKVHKKEDLESLFLHMNTQTKEQLSTIFKIREDLIEKNKYFEINNNIIEEINNYEYQNPLKYPNIKKLSNEQIGETFFNFEQKSIENKNVSKILKDSSAQDTDNSKLMIELEGVQYLFSLYKNKRYFKKYRLVGFFIELNEFKLLIMRSFKKYNSINVFLSNNELARYVKFEDVSEKRNEISFFNLCNKNMLLKPMEIVRLKNFECFIRLKEKENKTFEILTNEGSRIGFIIRNDILGNIAFLDKSCSLETKTNIEQISFDLIDEIHVSFMKNNENIFFVNKLLKERFKLSKEKEDYVLFKKELQMYDVDNINNIEKDLLILEKTAKINLMS